MKKLITVDYEEPDTNKKTIVDNECMEHENISVKFEQNTGHIEELARMNNK